MVLLNIENILLIAIINTYLAVIFLLFMNILLL